MGLISRLLSMLLARSGPKCDHDWYEIEEKASWQVVYDFTTESAWSEGKSPPPPPCPTNFYLKTCVCLKCHAVIDEIGDYKEQIAKELERKKQRDELARSIYQSIRSNAVAQ